MNRRTEAASRLGQWPHCTLFLAVAVSGCGAGWRRVEMAPDNGIDPRQIVEVWHQTGREEWHGVRVLSDTVTGIPYLQRLDCDSCRRSIERIKVDSLRFGDPSTPGVAVALAPVVLLLAMAVFFNLEGGLRD